MRLFRSAASILPLVLLLSACASPSNHVVFVTKTSLGIDVDSTPPGASIAYDRVEGYIGPRYENGAVPPVAGSFSTNGKLLDRQIKQVYATGNAARAATQITNGSVPPESYTGDYKVMYFGTGTVLGIKLAFGATGVDSFTLGYKRKEMSLIPVGPTGFPSVLATLDNTVQAATQADSALGIEQFFATGAAATQLASLPSIQQAFKSRATDAITQYRADERQQSRYALNALSCLAKLDDSQLPKVWKNAESLSLFDDPGIPARLRAASARDARILYTREISILNPKSQQQTGLMLGHQVYLCELAEK